MHEKKTTANPRLNSLGYNFWKFTKSALWFTTKFPEVFPIQQTQAENNGSKLQHQKMIEAAEHLLRKSEL